MLLGRLVGTSATASHREGIGHLIVPASASAPTCAAAPQIAPVRERESETDEVVTPDTPWDVIVWDDPVNLMSYVVYVFRKIFGFTEQIARKLMLDVHHKGKALVASEPREMAELHVRQLHSHGLQATMQRSR